MKSDFVEIVETLTLRGSHELNECSSLPAAKGKVVRVLASASLNRWISIEQEQLAKDVDIWSDSLRYILVMFAILVGVQVFRFKCRKYAERSQRV